MGDRRADERRAERLAAKREAERRERLEQERAQARREQLRSDALARSRMHDREAERRERLRTEALARAREEGQEAQRRELQRAAALERRRAAKRGRAREESLRAEASARRAGDRLTLDRAAEQRQARRVEAAVRRRADQRERDARALREGMLRSLALERRREEARARAPKQPPTQQSQTDRPSRTAPAKAQTATTEKTRPRTPGNTQREIERRREQRGIERRRADSMQRDRERRQAAAKQSELERRLAEREGQSAASTAAHEARQQARIRRVADWGRHVEQREAARARATRRIEEKREAIRSEAVLRRITDQRQALAPPALARHRQALRRQVERLGRRSAVPASGNPGPHVARLPSGVRSGVLPWLHTRGPVLLDEHNRPFTLRGVTVRGLERAEPAGGTFRAPVGERDLAWMRRWHVTAIAVPIAQDLALDGDAEADAESYLAALDDVIAAAARAGLYTIVRLSLLSSTLPTAPGRIHDRFDPPFPDAGSIDLWGVLARRYSREPAVLFELFRSPHDPDPGDSTAAVMRSVDWGLWTTWLLAMLGTLRREHPRSLAIMRGLRSGADLSGFPVPYTDGTAPANVIYAAALTAQGPDVVLESLRSLRRRAPVAVTELSAAPGDELRVERLGRQLAQLGTHWFAADWDSGAMPLVRRGRHGLTPTPLGRAFGAAFSVPYAIAPPRFHHFGAH